MQKSISSFDGVPINYRIHKAGKLFIVFLHGLGGDLAVWKRHCELLEQKGYSTLAIDLRGHGLSGRPSRINSYKLDNFSNDVLCVINHEKIKQFILIGHCFGGMVAINFHKLHPNKAEGYVLVNTAHKVPQRWYKLPKNEKLIKIIEQIMDKRPFVTAVTTHRDFNKFIGTSDWDLLRVYSDLKHTSIKSWLYSYMEIADFDGTQVMSSIKQPCLIVVGERDTVLNSSVSKQLHRLIKESQIKIVPHANHLLVVNNAPVLGAEIEQFITNFKKAAK